MTKKSLKFYCSICHFVHGKIPTEGRGVVDCDGAGFENVENRTSTNPRRCLQRYGNPYFTNRNRQGQCLPQYVESNTGLLSNFVEPIFSKHPTIKKPAEAGFNTFFCKSLDFRNFSLNHFTSNRGYTVVVHSKR